MSVTFDVVIQLHNHFKSKFRREFSCPLERKAYLENLEQRYECGATVLETTVTVREDDNLSIGGDDYDTAD